METTAIIMDTKLLKEIISGNNDVPKTVLDKLHKLRKEIADSSLLTTTIESLQTDFTHIRCLALGSPTQSTPALYQFAYLLEIQAKFKSKVSVFDPTFTEEDFNFFERYSISSIEDHKDLDSETTLYFLPHADLKVTNELIQSMKPKYLLGNNLVSHTDSHSKADLHEKYKILSHLVGLLDKQETSDFTVVQSKKKRNKIKYVPPPIVYNYDEMYFTSVDLTPIGKYGEYQNAFNDLALHVISNTIDI